MVAIVRRLPCAGLVLLGLAGACGAGETAEGTTTGPRSPTGFSVRNGSTREVWYLYSRVCGTASWGEDELGSANVLIPGESVTWSERAGCYDLLALTEPRHHPRYQARFDGQRVTSNQLTSLVLIEEDWTEAADTMLPALFPRM
jgi:hypothetical protein